MACNCSPFESRGCIILDLPDNINTSRNTRAISVDKCIAHVIKHLLDHEIQTLGSCCGHNGKHGNPSVIISESCDMNGLGRVLRLIAEVDNRDWSLLQWKLTKYSILEKERTALDDAVTSILKYPNSKPAQLKDALVQFLDQVEERHGAEIERLREALGFYEDESNWNRIYDTQGHISGFKSVADDFDVNDRGVYIPGKRARAVLVPASPQGEETKEESDG